MKTSHEGIKLQEKLRKKVDVKLGEYYDFKIRVIRIHKDFPSPFL